jgi:probable F420-dependent oxidoreductase
MDPPVRETSPCLARFATGRAEREGAYDAAVIELAAGRVGIWTRSLDRLPVSAAQEAAAELESLGYGALWVPEVIGREPLVHAALLLAGSERIVVGAGIANIHARSPMAMQSAWKTLTEGFPERFVLGLGVSQAGIVEGLHGRAYPPPYQAMVDYLDAMDAGTFVGVKPKTPLRRILAALRPRLMQLAAERTMGAITYLMTPEHTSWARGVLGDAPSLIVEQAAVLDPDPEVAREVARAYLATYLALPVYADRVRDLGWSDDDLAGPSDALVDAIVAWGTPESVADRLRAHVDAGADHVAVQVLTADPRAVPLPEWRILAQAVHDV